MSKQSNPHFYNMSMFALGGSILLVGMRVGYKMMNAYSLKKGVEGFVFPSPISLHSMDFLVKLTLN